MEIQITNTSKIVEVRSEEGGAVPARIWEGVTANGCKCAAFVTRLVCMDTEHCEEFERDLQETRAPSPEVQAFDLRLIL